MSRGITDLTATELLNLGYKDVIARVRSGEWDLEQFTQWAEDIKNYSWGDGYDEGYDTSAEVVAKRGTH